MGDIVGGIIGGIGSLIGGNQAAKSEQAAAKQALTGYNYLSNNPLINSLQTTAGAASTGEADTAGSIHSLLTSPDQNSPAFKNYLNSTGYQFQLDQGSNAITGNAAAKGILNSGATAKALTGYGQNLASTTFNNYLGQLGGLASVYSDQAKQGAGAAESVGAAGTTGGANQAQMTAAAGQSQGSSLTNAFNVFGGGVQNSMNNGTAPNFFSQPVVRQPTFLAQPALH